MNLIELKYTLDERDLLFKKVRQTHEIQNETLDTLGLHFNHGGGRMTYCIFNKSIIKKPIIHEEDEVFKISYYLYESEYNQYFLYKTEKEYELFLNNIELLIKKELLIYFEEQIQQANNKAKKLTDIKAKVIKNETDI